MDGAREVTYLCWALGALGKGRESIIMDFAIVVLCFPEALVF